MLPGTFVLLAVLRPRPVFLPLSTLDITHVRRCTRPSPLYRTASDEKLCVGKNNNKLTFLKIAPTIQQPCVVLCILPHRNGCSGSEYTPAPIHSRDKNSRTYSLSGQALPSTRLFTMACISRTLSAKLRSWWLVHSLSMQGQRQRDG